MPIGTGKGNLFGGGVSIEAGSQTFNSPGTFTVPPGLTTVSITGRGGSGNDGTPGGAGPSGAGGAGGTGGLATFPTYNPVQYFAPPNYYSSPGKSGGAGGNAHFAPSGGAAGNAGTATSVFGHNVGNTGTGGTGGTGGFKGNAGGAGPNGLESPVVVANAQSNYGHSNRGAAGNSDAVGPGAAPALYHGKIGGYGAAGAYCIIYCGGPIQIAYTRVWSGSGGGGAGVGAEGQYPCNSQVGSNPGTPAGTYTYKNQEGVAGGQSLYCNTTYGVGGYGGGGGYAFCTNSAQSNPGFAGGHGYGPTGRVPDGALGGGGGGGGGGGYRSCMNFYRGQIGTGGAGGGSGGQAVYGNAGNTGNSGNPGSTNDITVNAGDYPVVVGTGGTVTISWNAQ